MGGHRDLFSADLKSRPCAQMGFEGLPAVLLCKTQQLVLSANTRLELNFVEVKESTA
jgi:hypothetical protein